MSYIKTNWINDQTELNAENMNHIEDGIEQAYGQILLAVDSVEPEECNTGDRYYNIEDNLIYTAIERNIWGGNGVAPEYGVFYIVLDDQTIYTYNGATLVSVGGGAGGGGETLPVGTVLEFPTTDSTKVPDGWLFCDGSAVSRTTYSDLFAIIGTSFGAGDGSTTFNLPTKEGLVSVGIKSSDTDFNTIGKTGGSKYLQEHKHKWANDNGRSYAGAYGWNYSAPASGSNFPAIDDTSANTGGVLTTGTGGVQTGNSGNLQPYTVTNYIIKATQTTPVQAEVVNDYSTSQENAYSCDYMNGTVLYESSTGTTGNITLNDAIENYRTFEVYFTTESDYTGIVKYFVYNGATYTLDKIRIDTSVFIVFQEKIQISGTSLTSLTNRSYSNTSGIVNDNKIKILKIIGYK